MNIFSTQHLEKGFSLTQVMVAMGLAGMLSLYLMRLSDNQMKQQKSIEMRAGLLDVEQLIRQTLYDNNTCYHTFKQTFPGGTLDGIRTSGDANAPYFAKVNEPFKYSDVYINEMYMLTRAEELDPAFGGGAPLRADPNPANIVDTNGIGYAYLRMSFTKGKSASDTKRFYGGKSVAKIFRIKAKFSTPTMMFRCDETDAKAECENPANIPPNGSAVYSSIDEDGDGNTDTVNLGPPGCGGTGVYLKGKCTVFDPNAGIISCHN